LLSLRPVLVPARGQRAFDRGVEAQFLAAADSTCA
jgi:hypothetical protein